MTTRRSSEGRVKSTDVLRGSVVVNSQFSSALMMVSLRTEKGNNVCMRKLIFLLALSSALGAQPVISITGPSGTIRAGSQITLTISVTGTAGTNMAATQFTVSSIGSWAPTAAIGSAETAAVKSVTCAAVSGAYSCIVDGLNATALADGTLATITATLPRNSSTGTVTLSLSNTMGADSGALNVTVGAGAPFALSAASACDLTGDGQVTAADHTAGLPVWLGVQGCSSLYDLNSDGKCNVLDAQIIDIAASGGACAAK